MLSGRCRVRRQGAKSQKSAWPYADIRLSGAPGASPESMTTRMQNEAAAVSLLPTNSLSWAPGSRCARPGKMACPFTGIRLSGAPKASPESMTTRMQDEAATVSLLPANLNLLSWVPGSRSARPGKTAPQRLHELGLGPHVFRLSLLFRSPRREDRLRQEDLAALSAKPSDLAGIEQLVASGEEDLVVDRALESSREHHPHDAVENGSAILRQSARMPVLRSSSGISIGTVSLVLA